MLLVCIPLDHSPESRALVPAYDREVVARSVFHYRHKCELLTFLYRQAYVSSFLCIQAFLLLLWCLKPVPLLLLSVTRCVTIANSMKIWYHVVVNDVKKEVTMANYCSKCRSAAHSSKFVCDKRLGLYYYKGLCLDCYPVVVKECTKICVECHNPFLGNQGLPRNMCPGCRAGDIVLQSHVVEAALTRKSDEIASNDLTVDAWLKTIQRFKAKCAYCQICAYECLEHFVPLKLGGGTCANNVVPSCLSCNALKKNLHPALVKSIPQSDIDRVRSYLLSL